MAMVLVVDDEAPIVDLLVDIIEERGHTVLRAGNGAEALTIARDLHPDLIISDIMMPALDGYALLEQLRDAPDLARTRVILMSAAMPKSSAAAPSGRHQRPSSADGFLPKPFDVVAVESLLDQFVP